MSGRTVMPATMVANHKNVPRRENAGRSNSIAFHHAPHSDNGRPQSDMVPIHRWVGSGPLQGSEIHDPLTMPVRMIGRLAAACDADRQMAIDGAAGARALQG